MPEPKQPLISQLIQKLKEEIRPLVVSILESLEAWARPQSPALIKSLEELISDYDRTTLIRALGVLKSDLGWQILRAALMKEYLRTVAYQMDLASKTGTQIESAYQAGCAQTMYDTANTIIDQYVKVLENRTAVLEEVRPEE